MNSQIKSQVNPKKTRHRATFGRFAPAALLLVGLLTTATAQAGAGAYKQCDIVNGQVFSCGSWYQGKAVVSKDNAFRECDIVNGQIFSCGSWYQGKAVVSKDNAFRECDIVNGQIFSCGSWYQGKAVVYTNR